MGSSKEATVELSNNFNGNGDGSPNLEGWTEAHSNDQADMRRMGRQQQLKRNFHSFSILGLTCVAMGTWLNIILLVFYLYNPT